VGLHALQNCRLHNVLLQILKIDVETPTPGWTHGLLHYMKTVETGIENRKLDDVSGADFVVLPPFVNKLGSSVNLLRTICDQGRCLALVEQILIQPTLLTGSCTGCGHTELLVWHRAVLHEVDKLFTERFSRPLQHQQNGS